MDCQQPAFTWKPRDCRSVKDQPQEIAGTDLPGLSTTRINLGVRNMWHQTLVDCQPGEFIWEPRGCCSVEDQEQEIIGTKLFGDCQQEEFIWEPWDCCSMKYQPQEIAGTELPGVIYCRNNPGGQEYAGTELGGVDCQSGEFICEHRIAAR